VSVRLNDADTALVEEVRYKHRCAETEHKQFRKHASEFYGLYRGLQDFRDSHRAEPDRDVVVRRAKKEWGAELFIPMAYRTVETIVPRMLAHRPRMNPIPEDDVAVGTVENMRRLIAKQQAQIRYEVELQKVCKDGLIYGLGVQKTGWRTTKKNVHRLGPSELKDWTSPVNVVNERVVFDDPYAEWIDPFAFLWDPYGHSVGTCEYVFHRVYRSSAYVQKMVEAKLWRSGEWDVTCDWTLEDLRSTAPANKEDEIQSERRQAEGYNTSKEGPGRHEVWEYHDGERVVVILNGEFPVMVGENPMPDGSLPFQVFRPTIIGGRMVGIGEIEPIKDLQYELNTLRGQRVDAGTMALNRGYFFDESLVNADDLQIGPNLGVPVNGSPRDALWPMQIAEVPQSAFQESAAIQSDIESIVGITDGLAGANDQTQQTATGAQLVVQAAGIRIENKTRLMGEEVIIPAGEQFVLLNQSHILSKRTMFVPSASTVESPGLWEKVELGPEELQGLMSMQMDDGSTMAENVPQQRQDMQTWMGLLGNPAFDQAKVAQKVIENAGVKTNPQAFLVPQEPQIPASLVESALGAIGVPNEVFMQALDAVQQQSDQGEQGQPQGPAEEGQ
jgi:hypothetical protein